MQNHLFPNEPPEVRLQLMKDNCYNAEEIKQKRFFSEDEKNKLKDDITNDALRSSEIEDQIKSLTQPLKEELKSIKSLMRVRLTDVRKGYEDIEATVYCFDDQEEGMMNSYDENGTLVSSRKLYPSERQTKIVALNKVNQL